MIHILICDDDPVFLGSQVRAITGLMQQLGLLCQVRAFSGKDEIPDQAVAECDLAFLDIDFPRSPFNGIDIARRIRSRKRDAVIVFVTNFVEYAPEGYEVQAFRYLLKSEAPRKLGQILTLALEQLRLLRKTYPIQISGETIQLPIEDLLYIESQKHTCIAHVRRGSGIKTYSFYASLRSVEEALEKDGFLRVQKSYLVNMRHILRYQSREVLLTGGLSLPVSEKTYGEQKKKYLLWKGRQ